jgi:DNA mismatch repair protein MutL
LPKINILDDFTVNQIAAGEVIERPSSIVKELVENSIDAGSSAITIEIQNGGYRYIRVTDNGKGMDKRDARLCFQRHATSKIKSKP